MSGLNLLFRRKGIEVHWRWTAPARDQRKDRSRHRGHRVHGRTSAETDGSGRLLRADVRLPVKLTINTPKGEREAGTGMAEVVAAHEFVHALGHAPHNSHLMAQTLHKVMGDRAAGDKLKAGSDTMPPLQLSDESVEMLKGIWG